MITEDTRTLLTALAQKVITALTPLQQTQALVLKFGKKLDRIDTKLLKEANKLNRKE
jgi:hypothetical protein